MSEEDKKINKLIEESGMITHFKTTSVLRKSNWEALVSPYYHDSISDSIRETDLVAEKRFNSADSWNSSVQLNVQFFIECKYIKQEIVFWFDEIDKKKMISSLEGETGLKVAYQSSGDISSTDFHYFRKNSVAKLFSTNSNKEDVMYKAMNQCLHSQINYRREGKKPIFNKFTDHKEVFSSTIQYPVIICDNFDNLLEVKFAENGKFSVEKLKNHFILETNYRNDYFLIDVVDFNYLETFLKEFETEAQLLVRAYGLKHG